MVGITQEKEIVSFISIWSLQSKILEILELKLMLSVSKNEHQSILRLFESINIKHYKIMNSRN